MALDAYSPCPCGSGKKFKWCCQPIHVQIDKAFRQDVDGQHEAALRLMDQVLIDNAGNPEAWGRKAQLLYQNERVEEAENALQKALDINPDYPFGNLLRGIFRQNEGELPGALLLFRRAAELYDPEARDHLGQVYALIAECELKLYKPVAARAAFQMVMRGRSGEEDVRRTFDAVFGDASILPAAARREYSFQRSSAGASDASRQRWDEALARAATGRLCDAARVFDTLAQADSENAAAWYNLGLCRAWLGDNSGALAALDRYVGLEPDEAVAAAAWTLGEVLRSGHGMEEQADYIETSAQYKMHNPKAVFSLLERWESDQRLIGVRANEEQGIITGLIVQRTPDLTPALLGAQLPGMGAHLLMFADLLRLRHINAGALALVRQELEQQLGPALSEASTSQGAAPFADILADALAFPVHETDEAEARRRVVEHLERYFEEKWVHRPLRALNLIAPIDAAGHPILRKKLLGVIQFLADCAAPTQVIAYDFDRLRRKLGLLPGSEVAAAASSDGLDYGSMSAAELAAAPAESLDDKALEQAYRAALKLDAREIAGRFARELVSRPPRADHPDRYPWYSHLIQQAIGEGEVDAALDFLNEGERVDCEHNEGRRRNDYELRRGQVHAKRGDVDEAQSAFERLISLAPAELRFTGSAAEAMLGIRQPARALQFAEKGLAKAREKNDRDSEEYFKELVAAARKQE